MRKLFLAILTATCFTHAAQAQLHSHSNSYAGVKVGGSAASFIGQEAKNLRYVYGVNAGVFANFSLGQPFSIQPELLYSMKGVQQPIGISETSTSLTYIDVPVALRATNADGLFLEGGPQLGVLLTAKSTDAAGEKLNVKDQYQTVDIGYVLGVGYQPPRGGLGGGGRFNSSFLSAFKDPLTGGEALDQRNSVFQLYLSYSPSKIHKNKPKK